MRALRRRLAVIIAAFCALVLLPIATNIATGIELPPFLARNRWWSWVGVVVFGLIATVAAVRDQTRERRSPAAVVLPDDRSRAIHHVGETIRQRLHQSMGEMVRAELELDSVRSAVAPPTLTYVGVPGGTWEPDRNSTAVDAFDRFDESLLILGEPGAGKTTMLFELASAILDRAANDGPLPVLVELGAWRPAERRTARMHDDAIDASDAFRTWLLGQVQASYSIGADIAATWLDQRGLVLLFDGLDEVAARLQAECVKQINGLQTRYPRLRIAVTSRSEQYGRLPDLLALRGAIVIRPLTEAQITAYLSDPALASLHRNVQADPTLRELLTAPLWLYVMTLAFQHAAPVLTGDVAERRRQLFDRYAARMLSRRRGAGLRHDPARTIRWLIQIARSMRDRERTPPWSNQSQERVERAWFESLPVDLSAYVANRVLPVTDVLLSLTFLWLFGRHLGPIGSLIGLGICVWMGFGRTLPPAPAPSPADRWRCWRWTLLALLVTAASIILAVAVAHGADQESSGIRTLTVAVLLPGVWFFVGVSALVNRRLYEVPTPFGETTFLGVLRAVRAGFWLVVVALVIRWAAPVTASLFRAFLDGMLLAGVAVLIRYPLARTVREPEDQSPAFKRAGQVLVVVGGAYILAAWRAGLAQGMFSLKGGLLLVASWSTAWVFFYWVDQPWRDRASRLDLAMLGLLPWRMRAFLNETVDLGLMQREPGGYRFPHLLITEYFAAQDPLTAVPPAAP